MTRLSLVVGLVAALVPGAALACGGFFAQEVEVAPDQKIIVVHRDGQETYIFRPHFCGAAKDFGVILPIPATLSSDVKLGDSALYDQLDSLTAPESVEVCESNGSGFGCGGAAAHLDEGRAVGVDAGSSINIIDTGRVGIFSFKVLQAASVAAFTSWLDANGYPHDDSAGTDAYQYYVSKQWYFVAFQVTATADAPPAGKKLCGDLGPLQLTFPSAQPVIPARIASVNQGAGSTPKWRVVLIAAGQKQLVSGSPFSSTLYFSKALTSSDLSPYPSVSGLARDGERMTVLDVQFPYTSSDDIGFEDASAGDYRTQKMIYKDCSGGCAVGGTMPLGLVGVTLLLGMLAGARRASRRREQT